MPGIRVDAGFAEGGEVTVHYDPMIAKVIATAGTRDAARHRLITALRSFPILGLRTNIPFLITILEHPRFLAGDIDTGFLDREAHAFRPDHTTDTPPEVLAVAQAVRTKALTGGRTARAFPDPWSSLRGARV
jgi:acetyl/propionyl-CoA carboxylase alpha subunit